MKRLLTAASVIAAMPAAALAQDADQPLGQPHDWQIGMQTALSPVQHQMVWFNDYVLFFIIPITALVAGLLGWCIYRYSAARNPVPSRTSHNTVIEVIWTVAPILVLLCIAFPSFQILTAQYNPPSDPELTIKATGYQWYWGYEYQPVGQDPANEAQNVSFDSYMLHEEDRADSGKTDMRTYPRLLAVDNELVLPVGTVIRVITTGADVIHSWAMPSLGVKVDAVPGRLNEYWFSIDKPGLFYGQCSELCGKDHAFMPIAVRAVEKDQFQRWLAAAGTSVDDANKQLNAELDSAKRVALAGR